MFDSRVYFRRLMAFLAALRPFLPALLSFDAPLRARLPAFLASFLTLARFLAPCLPESMYAPAAAPANAAAIPNLFIFERFLVAILIWLFIGTFSCCLSFGGTASHTSAKI